MLPDRRVVGPYQRPDAVTPPLRDLADERPLAVDENDRRPTDLPVGEAARVARHRVALTPRDTQACSHQPVKERRMLGSTLEEAALQSVAQRFAAVAIHLVGSRQHGRQIGRRGTRTHNVYPVESTQRIHRFSQTGDEQLHDRTRRSPRTPARLSWSTAADPPRPSPRGCAGPRRRPGPRSSGRPPRVPGGRRSSPPSPGRSSTR